MLVWKKPKTCETSALIWNWSKETFSVLNVGRQGGPPSTEVQSMWLAALLNANYKKKKKKKYVVYIHTDKTIHIISYWIFLTLEQ